MSKTQAVTTALFGAGARGELNLATLAKRHGEALKIVAVAEPDDRRREHFANLFGIEKKFAFRTWDELIDARPPVQSIINALPCRMHYDSTLAALEAGFHVFLEKPMALTPGGCVRLTERAAELDRVLLVSLQSRYNKIYSRMRSMFDAGKTGRLMSIDCAENIGYWHFILSYVRGIHRRRDLSHSFVMAKGVHDLDLVAWFAGAPATKVASFGALSFFNEQNAPEGAPKRCMDGCPVFDSCLFNAYKQFVDPGRPDLPWKLLTGMSAGALVDAIREPRFRTLASVISHDISRANIEKILRETDNGRCVFRCDNEVVDHQSVSIEFENQVTASFMLNGFSAIWERSLNLHGTEGEIRSADFTGHLETRTYQPARVDRERIRYHGIIHGGGDEQILLAFADAVRVGTDEHALASAKQCLESHLLCFAAEQARETGQVVDMAELRSAAKAEAGELSKVSG
jgi:predicted dehydrogenase